MLSKSHRGLLLGSTLVGLFLPGDASADTTIKADSTSPIVTSASGDVTVNEDITVNVSGADAITIDSDNTVSVGDDAVIYADDADGRSGVVITSGSAGTLENDGYIYVIEDYVADDEDNNNRPDNAIASASDRYGVDVQSTTGSIDNDGVIYVEGVNSTGVRLVDGWAGSFDNDGGSIYVLGEGSTGVSASSVATDLRIGGDVTVAGYGSSAIDITGDVDGQFTIDGDIVKAMSYTTDDSETYTFSRSLLRDAAAAVQVGGSVSGGILIDARPYDLDDDVEDEDGDGVDDDEEPTGTITSYGESPALLIGSDEDITIGTVTGRDGVYSLAVDGTISSNAYYSAFDTVAVVIGGQGGTVDMSGGIGVSGTITATTNDSQAIALLINEGATVPALDVSGSIVSSISSSGEGSSIAVRDLSGTLATINNSGTINGSGSAEDETIALDLSANTSGVTIYQYLNDIDADTKADEVDDDDYDPTSPTIYTSITGDILTGSGDDLLNITSGRVSGDSYLGLGDDTVLLSDDSRYVGDLHSEGGTLTVALSDISRFTGIIDADGDAATLTISDDAEFIGGTEGADQLSISVLGGSLIASDDNVIAFQTLEVAADGVIGIVIDPEAGTNSTFSGETATFAEGAGVTAEITSLAVSSGSYTVLTAESIEGAASLDESIDLPLLYSASLTSDDNSITLNVTRKTAEQLGLTSPQSAAYDAVIASAINDDYIDESLLQVEDVSALQGQIDGLLPDYSGGVFDFVTRGSRLAARHISDNIGMFDIWPTGLWVEGLSFSGSKDYTSTLGYKTGGFGISGGFEQNTVLGYLGLSLTWVSGSVKAGGGDLQDNDASTMELAGHWRKQFGKLFTFARASVIRAKVSSDRTYTGTIDDEDFTYSAQGDWKGTAASAMAGLSYDFDVADRLTVRPKVVADFYWLKEKGYEETADSDAMALTVDGRTSRAATATGTVVASYKLGNARQDETPLTFEFEGGRRQVLSGKLGKTTAAFEDGDSFTLTPDSLKGAWTAEARLLAGGWYHTWQLAAGAEKGAGDIDLSVRASLSLAF